MNYENIKNVYEYDCNVKGYRSQRGVVTSFPRIMSREPLYSNATHYSLMSCIRSGDLMSSMVLATIL